MIDSCFLRCVMTIVANSIFSDQVKIWFQNRRAKERKQMKKRDELIHKEKLDVAAAAAGKIY